MRLTIKGFLIFLALVVGLVWLNVYQHKGGEIPKNLKDLRKSQVVETEKEPEETVRLSEKTGMVSQAVVDSIKAYHQKDMLVQKAELAIVNAQCVYDLAQRDAMIKELNAEIAVYKKLLGK